MIDQIIKAMATKIHDLFPDANIYTEPIEQGLEEPAFYIHNINIDHHDQIAGRFIHSIPFEVVYFTDKGTSDNNATLQTLLASMRLIAVKEVVKHEVAEGEDPIADTVIVHKIRGYGLNGRMIDSELHFFVNYDVMLTLKAGDPDFMDELKVTIEGGTDG